ncbi:MAG: type secretion system protein [Frankiales bacterium]|nr:type secretion system protein [Frankiales bacterium]
MMTFAFALMAVSLLLAGRRRVRTTSIAQAPGVPPRRLRLAPVAGLASGVACLALTGSAGVVLAPPAALIAYLLISRLEARRRQSPVDLRALARGLDLIAAALDVGLPVDAAIITTADCVGELGDAAAQSAMEPLCRVGRLLRFGADPTAAWSQLAAQQDYGAVAAAGRRCAQSGAKLAGAMKSAAHELREVRASRARTQAERVGVWTLLPLGLCYLPAFVCLGVVPVVLGIGGQILGGTLPS